MKTEKLYREINETKQFFENANEIENFQQADKKKRENSTTDYTGMKRIRGNYKQLYKHKFDNLNKMDQLLKNVHAITVYIIT